NHDDIPFRRRKKKMLIDIDDRVGLRLPGHQLAGSHQGKISGIIKDDLGIEAVGPPAAHGCAGSAFLIAATVQHGGIANTPIRRSAGGKISYMSIHAYLVSTFGM